MHQFNKLIIGFSVLFYSIMASAADSNWVIGGGLGQSIFKLNAPAGYSVSGASETAKSTAYDFFIGYKINTYIAVEAGYLNLGEYKISGSRGNSSAQASAKISGVTLAALWKYPLNDQWSVFARTGLIAGTAKTSVTVNNPPNASSYNQDNNSGVLPVWGLGVGYAINKEWEVRGQYQDIGATKV
ncbi:MAG: outer membrane beta-barrel protein, partial [Betaproteobacteria bacterium]